MVLILSIYSMYLQQYYSACRAQLKKLKDWNTIPCLFVRQQRISMEKTPNQNSPVQCFCSC